MPLALTENKKNEIRSQALIPGPSPRGRREKGKQKRRSALLRLLYQRSLSCLVRRQRVGPGDEFGFNGSHSGSAGPFCLGR
ncbi:MAG: hypothetical protein QOH42_2215, partial [Blastocatellia bacterium]|nr:hypothetical protein [Blastocatellia bacterium]